MDVLAVLSAVLRRCQRERRPTGVPFWPLVSSMPSSQGVRTICMRTKVRDARKGLARWLFGLFELAG